MWGVGMLVCGCWYVGVSVCVCVSVDVCVIRTRSSVSAVLYDVAAVW